MNRTRERLDIYPCLREWAGMFHPGFKTRERGAAERLKSESKHQDRKSTINY